MEVNSKFLDSANALLQTKIASEIIEKKVLEIATKTAKKIKIDGFRPGKVPVSTVISRYKESLQQDAESELIREIIKQGLKSLQKEDSEVLGEPAFSKFDKKQDGIEIELELSFRPKVDVNGYESAISEYNTPKVFKKEIDAKINEILESVAPLEKSQKDTIENGDFAKFDFEGFLNGEPFEGGKANDYVLQIGSNQFIPGFEESMVGMKVGEEKEISVKFPDNYGSEKLAGKDVVFKIKLHEIQEKKIAQDLDEEFLKRALPGEEEPTREKFEEQIKSQIKEDKFQKLLNDELKPKFADAVLDIIKFDLPKNIVEQEIDMLFRGEWQNYSPEDMKKFREDKESLKAAREKYREQAEKSVKLTFIIDELAKINGIEVNDNEVVQNVYFEAYRYGIEPKKHLQTYQERGMLPAIKMAIVEDKLFNKLFRKES